MHLIKYEFLEWKQQTTKELEYGEIYCSDKFVQMLSILENIHRYSMDYMIFSIIFDLIISSVHKMNVYLTMNNFH